MRTGIFTAALAATSLVLLQGVAWAAPAAEKIVSPDKTASGLQLVVLLTLASLLPAIVLTATCFARFLIVFSFLRSGLAAPGAPPSQVLIGLALFMTMFVMAPVATELHEKSIRPYMDDELSEREAFDAGAPVLLTFLVKHTQQKDLALFYEFTDEERPKTVRDVPLRIALPAFTPSDLRTAFHRGLVVLLPFLIIDLVVATVLSSLGMVMLPPSLVSLPVKLLVFVAADGWYLLVSSLLHGVAT